MKGVAAAALALLLLGCSPRFDWRELRGPPGTFIVALPGKAQTASREIDLTTGSASQRIEMSMFSAGIGASLFAVGTTQLPASALATPADLQQTLDWFRDGLVRNIGADAATGAADAGPPAGLADRRLRAAQSFAAAGRAGPGGAPARLAARLYVVDDRLYQLVVISAEGEVPPLALETFFDSFRLMPR